MFTIKTIRADTCDDCHVIGNGVEFVLEQDPGAKAFLCWKHFRMTLEAMRIASMVPVDQNGSSQDGVHGDAAAPQPASRPSVSSGPVSTPDEGSRDAASVRLNFMHGRTKGGTDRRDTGGEG